MGFTPERIRRYRCDCCGHATIDVATNYEQSYADKIARKNGWSLSAIYGWVCRTCKERLRQERQEQRR